MSILQKGRNKPATAGFARYALVVQLCGHLGCRTHTQPRSEWGESVIEEEPSSSSAHGALVDDV
jgi:hypothetical protein